jgi:hypothetical protein
MTADPVVTQGEVWTVQQWNEFFASTLLTSNNLSEIAAAGPAAQAAALANIGATGPLAFAVLNLLSLPTSNPGGGKPWLNGNPTDGYVLCVGP